MAAEIKCMKCGAGVVAGSKFCPYCGAAVQVPVTTTATTTPPQGTPVPPKTDAAPEAAPMEVAEGDLGFFDEKPAHGAAPAGPKEVTFTPVEEGDGDVIFDDEDELPARRGGVSPRTTFRAVQPGAARAKPGDIAKAKAEAQAQADAKAKAEAAARYAAGQAAVRALERHEPVDEDDDKGSELLELAKREFRRRSAKAKKGGWLKPALAVLVLILAIVVLAMSWRSCGSPPDYTTAPPRRPAPTRQQPAWTEPAETEPTPAQEPAPPNDGEFPLCSTGRRHRIVISLAEYAEGRQDGYDLVLTRNGGQTTVRCRVAPRGDDFTADCCR